MDKQFGHWVRRTAAIAAALTIAATPVPASARADMAGATAVVAPRTSSPGPAIVWDQPTHETSPDVVPAVSTKTPVVSCPTTSFCAMSATSTGVAISTNPVGGDAAWVVAPGSPQGIGTITCLDATFCFDGANSRYSVNPNGGTWINSGITGIQYNACASASLCVVVGGASVSVSTDLPSGTPTWSGGNVDYPHSATGIACPFTALCVGVNNAGNVFYSTNPAGGVWTLYGVAGVSAFASITCIPGTTKCLAADTSGNLAESADPTAGAGSWTVTDVNGSQPITALACASTTLCVGVDATGAVLTSSDPTNTAVGWNATHPNDANLLGAVTCAPASTLCLVTGRYDDVYVNTDPVGTPSSWIRAFVSPRGSVIDTLVCPTTTVCSGMSHDPAQQGRQLVATATPLGASSSWTQRPLTLPLTVGSNIIGEACPSATLCLVSVDDGRIMWTATPAGSPSAWAQFTLPGGALANDITCPSVTLCVARSNTGVAASSDPTNPASWHVDAIDPNVVMALTCASSVLCIAATHNGLVYTSTNPAGGVGTWVLTQNGLPLPAGWGGGPDYAYAASCPSPTLCIAVDGQNTLWSTTDPTTAGTWVITSTIPAGPAPRVTCPTPTLCLVADTTGGNIVSTNLPLGPPAAWVATAVDPGKRLGAVTCPSPVTCLVADNGGHVFRGNPPVPVVTSVSPDQGPQGGGTPVTISGGGFVNGGSTISWAGAPVSPSSVTPTAITFATPSMPSGPVHVQVSTAFGTSSTVGPASAFNGFPTSIVVTSSLNPASTGQSITFTANISGAVSLTGSVVFNDGITVLGSSPVSGHSATYTTALLAGGLHGITAAYSGDSSYKPSTSVVFGQFVTPTPFHAATLDGFGGIHAFGTPPVTTSFAPYWPGWSIARGIAVMPSGAGGYTLDGWGGVHPWGAAHVVPAVPAAWPGWDIARAVAINPCDPTGRSGYFLDGFGGVHDFGAAPHVNLNAGSYTSGQDIARAFAFNPCASGVVSGYVLNAFGAAHGFSTGAPIANATPAIWPGWRIARGIAVSEAGKGYILDGFGGLHPFGGAPALAGLPYFGWDIARGIVTTPDGGGGYTIDGFGGVHRFGSAPAIAAPPNAYWPGRDIGKGIGGSL